MESVIATVNNVCCGRRNTHSPADELASDIIAKLWQCGGFQWSLEKVRRYAAGHIRFMVAAVNGAKTKAFTDHETEEGFLPFEHKMLSHDDPFEWCRAQEAVGLLRHLPKRQAEALRILCEGGSPIDVANEFKIDIRAALLILKDARINIHRVANDEDYE